MKKYQIYLARLASNALLREGLGRRRRHRRPLRVEHRPGDPNQARGPQDVARAGLEGAGVQVGVGFASTVGGLAVLLLCLLPLGKNVALASLREV